MKPLTPQAFNLRLTFPALLFFAIPPAFFFWKEVKGESRPDRGPYKSRIKQRNNLHENNNQPHICESSASPGARASADDHYSAGVRAFLSSRRRREAIPCELYHRIPECGGVSV